MSDFDITCNRCKAPLAHRCGGNDLVRAIKRLYRFVPESGTPKAVITEGKKNGMWSKEDGEGELPFFTETFLYCLLGKEDARTLLALVSSVVAASGLEAWKIEQQAWHEHALEEAVKAFETRRREAIRARNLRNNKRMCTCGHPYEIHHTPEDKAKRKVSSLAQSGRVCTKCTTKCEGFTAVSEKDKLESLLAEADRRDLKVLRDEIVELQKDPDEERTKRAQRDWIHDAEEEVSARIADIMEETL